MPAGASLRSPAGLRPSVTVPFVIVVAEAGEASPSRASSARTARRHIALPAGYVGVALLDEHGLALLEVADRDLAALDRHLGAPAAVLGQPLGAADGGGPVPALR